MQVEKDTWEPTVIVWTEVEFDLLTGTGYWTSPIGSISAYEAPYLTYAPALNGEGGIDLFSSFARAERALIAAHEAQQVAPEVVTLTVTADQESKINQALLTHIDAAVKAVRKARKGKSWGDGLNERLAFADLTVAIDTLRAIDPSVGDHFTAEWLIGGAR